jgi:cell division control protein 24
MEVVSSNYLVRSSQPGPSSRLRSYGGPSMPNPNPTANNPHFSSYSQQSLRSSDSTAVNSSQSTLYSPAPLPSSTPVNGSANGAPVQANNNVLNKRADKDEGIFQICLNLRRRLRGIPECDDALNQEEEDARMHTEEADPVTLIWRTFRQGEPLMAIYNALDPAVPLSVDPNKRTKRDQAATFQFINACIKQLQFPAHEMFMVTDLYGDDTTGFVKVGILVADRIFATGTNNLGRLHELSIGF